MWHCRLSPQPGLHSCSASAIKLTWSSSAHHHTVYQPSLNFVSCLIFSWSMLVFPKMTIILLHGHLTCWLSFATSIFSPTGFFSFRLIQLSLTLTFFCIKILYCCLPPSANTYICSPCMQCIKNNMKCIQCIQTKTVKAQ